MGRYSQCHVKVALPHVNVSIIVLYLIKFAYMSLLFN